MAPQSASSIRKQSPPKVEALSVSKKYFFETLDLIGNTYANESVNLTSPVTEVVATLHFDDGQFLQKDDLVAVLEKGQEEAELKAQEIQREQDVREVERQRVLTQKDASPQKKFNETRTRLKITEQKIKAIKSHIRDRTIRAPFDGMVGVRQISVGTLVEPGHLITTLDDISKIKLDVNVPTLYLERLKLGMGVEAKSKALGGRLFIGQVFSIDSRIDQDTRTILVRTIFDNPEKRLKPGLLMQVTLLKEKRESILVPEEAFTQRQNKHFVWLIRSGAANQSEVSLREVIVGLRKSGFAEVVRGLEAGDQIVSRGIHKLKEGQEVEVIKHLKGNLPAAAAERGS